jgi:hypothetical protein
MVTNALTVVGECLSAFNFVSLEDTQMQIEHWRQDLHRHSAHVHLEN